MRRVALLALALVPLAGCSGLGRFESDTLELPGSNPSLPAGNTETMLRVEAKPVDVPPLTTEAGNVWPGDPKPFPTLGEVEKQAQEAGETGGSGLGPGPGTASGTPSASASGGGSAPPGAFRMESHPNTASTIVIPNGNGTSTVIAPDGAVHIIPTPGTAAAEGTKPAGATLAPPTPTP